MADEINPITQRIAEFIANPNGGDPEIFDVKAPIKLAALGSDGRYRMIDLKDEEFFLKGVRPGKRSEWIVELAPISAAGYVHVELLDKDMASAMPTLEPHLVSILGFGAIKWRTAVKKYLEAEQQKQELAAKSAESAKYDTNPSWGTF